MQLVNQKIMKKINKNLGFSLIELMIAVLVFGIIMAFAMPSFSTWIQDAKTRTITESLQNGIRLAQAEAVNKGRQVAFFVTNVQPSSTAAATVTGSNWGVRVVVPTQADADGYIQGAVLNSEGGSVIVTASTAEIRFNAIGRLTNSPSLVTYNITNPKGARALRVVVSSSGGVRMCDPNKSLATAADGC
ncbi:MAG: GspH/FimT family pseudopilin [Methylotenera sp.]|nr:GspH/FimT family pseudopilin [Methylotenera sp.]MDO9233933.1 GspH/FimT family pseudopilin [Methylotenera sp.]MDO9281185.1 GspH/FimT family pseudopilin [Methylotenera sp.]MDO9388863.1 GspH/FimT family pseudopilin [Methylotenera sp.]MDP2102707.1 GspH/FimT family pseudopilin [Methylotenera sp.]